MSGAHVSGQRPLIGRQREIEELRAGLRAAAEGNGRLFLIVGEAGIGKTRLADEIAAEAASQGMSALWGRCWEGGGTPAFWPWSQVLRAHLRERNAPEGLRRLGPAASLVTSHTESAAGNDSLGEGHRFQLFQVITDFLRAESATRPLALIFDDLHVADEDSLVLLRFLARELRGMRLLVVATFREHEMGHGGQLGQRLAELGRESTTIPLRGLDEREVGTLVRSALLEARPADPDPVLPSQFIGAMHRITEGNPFFLHEITRSLLAEGGGAAFGRGAIGAQAALPVQVRAAIRQRLEPLPAEVVSMLSVAAVIGREFDGRLLEVVPGAAGGRASPGALLDAAVDAGVVRGTAAVGRHSFTHALIRETLYEDLPPAQRAALHHAVGLGLENLYASERDDHLAELAHHFFRAASAGDHERAIAYAEKAAARARGLCAYDEVVVQLSNALEVLDAAAAVAGERATDERRGELLVALGAALNDAGKRKEARTTFARATEVARRAGLPRLLARAALGGAGDWQGHAEVAKYERSPGAVLDESLADSLRGALEALGDSEDALRARLMSRLGVELYFTASLSEREELTRAARELADRAGDPVTRAHVLADTHVALCGPHNVHERLGMSREIVRLAQTTGQRWIEAAGRAYAVLITLELGDPAVVEAEAGAFHRLAGETRLPGLVWAVRTYDVMEALLQGRFAEAEQLAVETLDFGRRAQRPALIVYGLQMTALRREQGRLDEIRAGVGMLKAVAEQYPGLRHLRAAAAFLYGEVGDLEEARRQLEAVVSGGACDLALDVSWLEAMTQLSEACFLVGDVERAATLYATLLPYERYNAVAPLCATCWGSVARSLGQLATLLEDWENAERHFEAALERNRAFGARPWVAHTQHGYAEMLCRRQRRPSARRADGARARSLVSEAMATARELGMKQLESRLLELEGREGWSRVPPAGEEAGVGAPAALPLEGGPNFLRREGDFWTIGFGGQMVRLKDTRGVAYLAHLLRHPGEECSALDLVREMAVAPPAQGGNGAPAPFGDRGDAGELLDATAKAAYKRRVQELRRELEEAETQGDADRAEQLREEIGYLARELGRAVGLGGRDRRAASPGERARVRATRAINAVLKKIAEHHRPLAEHLEVTVRTGTFCSYRPDPRSPITWNV